MKENIFGGDNYQDQVVIGSSTDLVGGGNACSEQTVLIITFGQVR